jgi:hypothetical protein
MMPNASQITSALEPSQLIQPRFQQLAHRGLLSVKRLQKVLRLQLVSNAQ